MKIFDFNNPRHVEILKEELSRLKHILNESAEYNEDEIWSLMTPDERKSAILSASNDNESNLADEYMNNDIWNNIPQDLADHINLSLYQLASNDRDMGRVMLRGIESMKFEVKNDPEKLAVFKKLIDSFCKKLGKSYDQLNVRDSIKLNKAVAQLKQRFNPMKSTNTSNIGASADYGKGSRNWTGD